MNASEGSRAHGVVWLPVINDARDRAVALASLAVIAAIAFAGLVTGEPDDTATRLLKYVAIMAACNAVAMLVFGRVLPRARSSAERAGRTALALGGAALVLLAAWPGFALVLAPAAVKLGIDARGAGSAALGTSAALAGAVAVVAAFALVAA